MTYQHDSEGQEFLGEFTNNEGTFDLYVSRKFKEVIARFGDSPSDYSAAPLDTAFMYPDGGQLGGSPLREAAERTLRQ
jgi:hypothetical protein